MGMFKNLFTWWEGASLGTTIVSRRNGEEVGRDEAGNIYFHHRKDPKRRWVIYDGSNDSSRVPPGWNAWLRGTIDELPEKSLPARRKFEQAPQPNLTGTMSAFRPGGSLASKGGRPASTGDYEAWKPDQA
jgi:NADH:ubiquinone oxidoreductase subunit